MGQIGVVAVSLVLAAFLLHLLFQRRLLDAFIEEMNNFRGGPPTAMHPSPSDDRLLLRRPSRKIDD
jgi:hypothetical protein